MSTDEAVSQFMNFTGSTDVDVANTYLEMSGNNVETAVGLYMEHNAGGGGGGGSGAGTSGSASALRGGGDPFGGDIRAPDATRTMRLMDESGGGGGSGSGVGGGLASMLAHDPHYRVMYEMMEEQLSRPAFAAPTVGATAAAMDVRRTINAAAAAAATAAAAAGTSDEDDEAYAYQDDDEDDENMKEDDDDDDDLLMSRRSSGAGLADMFAAPSHLIHKAGGFQGARQVAKDSKRWLLVNIQRDSEFSSHALNRDVWRNDLVENLIREGFIFWQEMDISMEGRQYVQRYHVHDFPHIAILDPRTGRLMWKKEGWTQENPLTSEVFAEMAMDFCSRNSFDKPPQAPRPAGAKAPPKVEKPFHELSEEEQLQAAMRASMEDAKPSAKEEDDDVEYLGTKDDMMEELEEDSKPPAEPSLLDQLLDITVAEEPVTGARVQLRLPDGKRVVRRFNPSDPVKVIYAFLAQTNEDVKAGKGFALMAGFPPADLWPDADKTVDECKLSGQAISVRWKD